MLLVVVEIMPILYMALGFTFVGFFTKYKIFLLISLAPIIFLMYEYSSVVDDHEGMSILLTGFAGWILFNLYFAFFGGFDND